MTNKYAGECVTCGQHVAAGAGEAHKDGARWQVRHGVGGCPANPHNPDNAQTWSVSVGQGYGGMPYVPGSTIRESWSAGYGGALGVDGVPGGRDAGAGVVSGLVTVVTAGKRHYPEDGMSFGVGDEAGYVYFATVRAASGQEAAPVLAAEQRGRRERSLDRQVLALFGWGASDGAGGATWPAPDEVQDAALDRLPRVPTGRFGADRGLSMNEVMYPRLLLLDEPGGFLWAARHNGADGDDWSLCNYGRYLVLRHPLTDELRELVAALRKEYESVPAWVEAGYEADAAELLLDDGWTLRELDRWGVTARTAQDARVLVDWGREAATEAGWRWPGANFWAPAAEAHRLAAAGLTSEAAGRLHSAGYTAVEDKLAARAPQLPTTPGRFILPGRHHLDTWVYDDAALAAADIVRRPGSWKTWRHDPGVECVHVGEYWQLWSDGGITRGMWDRRGATPHGLSPVQAEVVALVALAVNVKEFPRDVRVRLADAAEHVRASVKSDSGGAGTGSWSGVELARHDVRFADGGQATLWSVHANAGGWAGGDADHEEWHYVYIAEVDARGRYAKEKAQVR